MMIRRARDKFKITVDGLGRDKSSSLCILHSRIYCRAYLKYFVEARFKLIRANSYTLKEHDLYRVIFTFAEQ